MNVFVVGTGRCGTCSVYQAFGHATNYTVGHERMAGKVPNYNLRDNHIEIGSPLTIAIPILKRKFPEAKWIHLIRDKGPCVSSLINQCETSMRAYARQWLFMDEVSDKDLYKVAALFYDSVNGTCRDLLAGEDYVVLKLSKIQSRWEQVWNWLGCEGSFEDSLAELKRHYNPSENRGIHNYKGMNE